MSHWQWVTGMTHIVSLWKKELGESNGGSARSSTIVQSVLPGGEKVVWHPIKWCHERRNQRWWVIVHDNDSWSNDVIRAGSLRMGAKISQNFEWKRLNFEYLQRSAFTEDLSCTKCYLWSRETFYMHYVICNYIT